MKKFFKKTEGFTLVELIVVIAILGILAGVGTVGYSGYIKKANLAADQQLLSALNTAFATACIENGVDVHDVDDAVLPLTSEKKAGDLTKVTINSADVSAELLAAYNAAFDKYFEGNEDIAFKVAQKLTFDPVRGAFIDPANTEGSIAVSYGGGTIYLNSADIAKLAASTFITAEDLGVDGLLNKVNEVTGFAAEMMGSTAMQKVFGSADFKKYAAEAMGIELTGDATTDSRNFQEVLESIAGTDTNAQNQVLANAAVLYAAKNTTTMNQSSIVDMLSKDGAQAVITGKLNSDPGTALAEAAIAYGMYTAYAYDSGKQELIDATENPTAILNGLDDDEFQKYMSSDKGKADLQGYISALNMVENSSEDTAAVTTLLKNGFADSNLILLLQQSVGQS